MNFSLVTFEFLFLNDFSAYPTNSHGFRFASSGAHFPSLLAPHLPSSTNLRPLQQRCGGPVDGEVISSGHPDYRSAPWNVSRLRLKCRRQKCRGQYIELPLTSSKSGVTGRFAAALARACMKCDAYAGRYEGNRKSILFPECPIEPGFFISAKRNPAGSAA